MLKNLCQKMFGRSLWVYHANSGGCNGCDIEVLNVLTPYYDVERFGIKLVGSPRHADVMLCQGPAMRATALRRAVREDGRGAVEAPEVVRAAGRAARGGEVVGFAARETPPGEPGSSGGVLVAGVAGVRGEGGRGRGGLRGEPGVECMAPPARRARDSPSETNPEQNASGRTASGLGSPGETNPAITGGGGRPDPDPTRLPRRIRNATPARRPAPVWIPPARRIRRLRASRRSDPGAAECVARRSGESLNL